MGRNLRFYFTLFITKWTIWFMKLLGHNATNLPGSVALLLCPDFLDRIEKPEKIIAITGTNGKTTVTNMLDTVLTQNGESFICNREGSNVLTGIVSLLVSNSTPMGKPKNRLAVLELDERSSKHFYPSLQPDILIVTNIFRDSYRRNAHTEFIYDILNKNVPKETKLILNGDDPLCAQIRQGGDSVSFGIAPLDFEDGMFRSLVRDGAVCPRCSAALTYDFTRYHHVGISHCDSCGFTFPERKYLLTAANCEAMTMQVKISGQEYTAKMVNATPINMYNQMSVLAALCEFGYTPEQILKSFETVEISETRLKTIETCGKRIIRFVAKGQNPVACSRAFDSAATFRGKKCVILFLDDVHDSAHSVENIAWFYDTDFEFLNHEDIGQIVIGGARHWDTYVRLLMAGVPKERIRHAEGQDDMTALIDFDSFDTFLIFDDIYMVGLADRIEKALHERKGS